MTAKTPKPHLTPEQIQLLIARIPEMPLAEKVAILEQIEASEVASARQAARDDFLVFCHRVYPGFKEGPHHRHLKPMLHDMARDDWDHKKNKPPVWAKRMTVSMPPRFGKSESIAYLYVAWYLGHNPSHQIIMGTHTEELSAGFGRKVRDLLDTAEYQAIFPDTKVSKDKSAAGNWTTTAKGVYLALGINSSAAGKGAHLFVADDLVSEQAVLANPDEAFEKAWTFLQVGPLQRLMPGGRIIMIGTRWGKKDPIGRALQWARENEDALPWHEVRFPAVMEVERDGAPTLVSLWPEQWPVEELLAKKSGMQPQFWNAQYMQEPTNEEGSIIKREWWRIWPHDDPPQCEFLIQTWDTAHDTKTTNDYSACQTWGVFFNEEEQRYAVILLNAFHKRLEFPDLKKRAKAEHDEWKPDALVIEKKAAGAPLIQELRRMGMFIEEVSPSRGTKMVSNDKRARLNAIAPVFQDGCVWAPDKRWAREVIELCAEFPGGEFDDPVDCTEMAIARFRRGNFVRLSTDEGGDEEEDERRSYAYY